MNAIATEIKYKSIGTYNPHHLYEYLWRSPAIHKEIHREVQWGLHYEASHYKQPGVSWHSTLRYHATFSWELPNSISHAWSLGVHLLFMPIILHFVNQKNLLHPRHASRRCLKKVKSIITRNVIEAPAFAIFNVPMDRNGLNILWFMVGHAGYEDMNHILERPIKIQSVQGKVKAECRRAQDVAKTDWVFLYYLKTRLALLRLDWWTRYMRSSCKD